MSNETYTKDQLLKSLRLAEEKDVAIRREDGSIVTRAEIEKAQGDFWGDGTIRLSEQPVTREIRRLLMQTFDIPAASEIVISWNNGQNKITLSNDDPDFVHGVKRESKTIVLEDGYTAEELAQAQEDFWK